jgi:hypothetical protein
MSLWWLEPGWADACCGRCGAHIRQSGGDPDWGLCWPCMQQDAEQKQREREARQSYEEELRKEHEAQREEYDSSSAATANADPRPLHDTEAPA